MSFTKIDSGESLKTESPVRLPVPLTPFFGRSSELQAIQGSIKEPECRLLTLIGPGGMGKTRLAIEAAQAIHIHFPDGVYFVDLQPLPSTDLLPITVINALGITHSQEDPLAHLSRFLANRKILLLMDNFEHLLKKNGLLSELLIHSPGLKIMVTSREALHLQEEWLFPVSGFELPSEEQLTPEQQEVVQQNSAVQMFAACARRVHPEFSLEKELKSVINICRLVEGMPLAIELAASWTRMLRCELIEREIKENIRFLTSRLHNIPERHRSFLAVFEQTWRMLSPEEQQVYTRLSVFRGGFDETSARQVAQADLGVMMSLVDKSLLYRIPYSSNVSQAERFRLHEVLRQFAHEHLAEHPEELRQAYDSHCHFYLKFLEQRFPGLIGGHQQTCLQEIQFEFENIRAAWNWAIQNGYVRLLRYAFMAIDTYFQFQSRFLEGATLFEQLKARLEDFADSEDLLYLRVKIMVYLGWLYIRLGKLDLAKNVFEDARERYPLLPAPLPPSLGSNPESGLAILAVLHGAYDEAVRLGEKLLQESKNHTDTHFEITAHYILASAWLAQGQYEIAQQQARQLCALTREVKDEWVLAYGLIQWGDAFYGLQDPQRARQLFLESYNIRKTFNDPEGMALALNHLGKVALSINDYAEAQRCFTESYKIYVHIFDQGGLSTALNGLGSVALGLGQPGKARKYLSQALQVAGDIQFVPLMMMILVSVARLFLKLGWHDRGLTLLQYVCISPASNQAARRLANQYLAQVQGSTFPEFTESELAQVDLDALVKEVLIEIETIPQENHKPDQVKALSPRNKWMEELTDREIEILRCLNDGLSNQLIADQLFLSLGTVKWYTSQIYSKLQVTSRTQAVAKARQFGLF